MTAVYFKITIHKSLQKMNNNALKIHIMIHSEYEDRTAI